NPGQCIEVAKQLLECIQPKWNPLIVNNDLCEELELFDAERAQNDDSGRETLTFDPLFRLTNFSNGFRIFAFEDHTTELSMKRYSVRDPNTDHLDIYLHAKLKYPGEARTKMIALVSIQGKDMVKREFSLLLSFLDTVEYPSFNTAILGGLFYVL
ncbi:hypothetical protein DFH07DRAFT_733987, partial [Mycena maculata]